MPPCRCYRRVMCGIAGLIAAFGAPDPDPLVLEAMQAALAHRGPDGGGRVIAGRVGLAHTRLAIIDLVTGDQPLHCGSAALIGNGEIYNDLELRAAMSGAKFATGSDNESALQAWVRDGSGFAGRLRGMFALAIHDKAQRTLTLARDPFGIKPLYIAETARALAFASEPQALLAAGIVSRGLRPAARDELLQMQFTTGAETIFPGIRRVLPGETLVCGDGRVLSHQRVDAVPGGGPEAVSEAEAMTRLDAALCESVALHQRSDVPYGMFLSGGIDSAALLTMMARLNDRPVLAFTAGFDVAGVADEREAASEVARSLGAHHETITVSQQDVWRHLPAIVACLDDPAADFAIIPTWFLARRARQDVKVVLSGEGGDEMFAGYGRYRSAMRPWWRGGRVMRARGTFDRVDVLRARPVAWRDGLSAAEAQSAEGGRTRLSAAQATDIADWLPHDLLTKLDRCLMAHAVEGRTPYLDPGVAGAVFRLPDALKVRDGMGKWLLRQWLARHCPAARPFARKQGFTVPVGAWISRQGTRLGPLVAAQPGVAEIADPERVVTLFRNAEGRREGAAAWALLFYALWHQAHVVGAAVRQADVFDALAAG